MNYSNRDFIERGIGHNERGIVRSEMVPMLLGHGSAEKKHEILQALQRENKQAGQKLRD